MHEIAINDDRHVIFHNYVKEPPIKKKTHFARFLPLYH